MNALKYCFFFFGIAISTSLEAAVEHFRSRADINNPPFRNEIRIEDDRFEYMKQNGGTGGSWTSEFINYKVSNRVYLGTDDALLLTTVPNYQLFVELEIKSYDLDDNVVNTQIVTLDVSYSNDPNQSEKNIHFFEFSGYHKFVTKILGFKDENGADASWVVNLYIENEIIIERYYAFDPSISYGSEDLNLDHRLEDTDGDGNMDEAVIYWEHLSGAEEYDLEWTFIDNYKPSGEVLAANQVEFVARDFDLNATRISTSQTYYKIPLVFDKGFVLYRLRPKGYVLSQLDQMMLGRWSTSNVENTASHVAGFGSYFPTHQTQDEHEKEKNWQYTATYAEDGKRKDLVNYYDATLRNRQTVSRINSLNKAVMLESFYNHNGQLSIQSLPTPVEKPTIKYYEAFNRGLQTNEPYNWTLFDVPNSTECIANAKPFLAGQGSAKYYGESPAQGNYHDYVADAEGFPFTQTQYTPDLTGRILKQAGVGKTFSMGNGHETQYFYAQPFQEELDRLFGYEAGYKSRYKKNMAIDPNGQVSISYLDERGQVIATALAGEKPSNLQVVADEFGRDISPAIQRLNIDLLNKDQANDPNDAEDDNNLLSTGRFGALKDALQFSSQIAVESNNSLYDFKYDLSFGAYIDQCISPRCYPFVYDLLISLKDICGKEQFSYNGIEENLLQETIYNIDPINHNCNHPQSFSKTAIDGLTKDLGIGTYTLSKQLSINEEALTVYTDAYIRDGQANGCIRTFEDFLEEEMALVDISNCEITCESCVENLGANDGSREWQAQYNECMQPCTPASTCETIFQTLLADISPYGQYGSVDTTSDEFILSLYNDANLLPEQDAIWRNPVDYLGEAVSYTDEQGNDFFILVTPDPNNSNYIPQVNDPSNVITNDDGQTVIAPQHLKKFLDFIIYWQPHWAENLVYYHPEFCYMTWCWEMDEIWEGGHFKINCGYGKKGLPWSDGTNKFLRRIIGHHSTVASGGGRNTPTYPKCTDIDRTSGSGEICVQKMWYFM